MLLSAVSALVVAQSSSEIPEGLMNNPVSTSNTTVASSDITFASEFNLRTKRDANYYDLHQTIFTASTENCSQRVRQIEAMFSGYSLLYFRRLAKRLRKAYLALWMSPCPSALNCVVPTHHRTNFRENSHFGFLRKFIETFRSSLKSDRNNRHFTRWTRHTHNISQLLISIVVTLFSVRYELRPKKQLTTET